MKFLNEMKEEEKKKYQEQIDIYNEQLDNLGNQFEEDVKTLKSNFY